MRSAYHTLVVIAFAAAAPWPGAGVLAAGSGAYKWVDEKGVVHYTDHIPTEALTRSGVLLDKQGRQVKKFDPPLTAEQVAARQAELEKQRSLEKLQEEQARRDRALMQSYSSAQEIDLARNRAISTLETQLKSAQGFISDLEKRGVELQAQKRGYGTKPTPAALERELAGIDEEIARQTELISQRRQEMGLVATRYGADRQRWEELKKEAAAAAPPTSPAGAGSRPANPSGSDPRAAKAVDPQATAAGYDNPAPVQRRAASTAARP